MQLQRPGPAFRRVRLALRKRSRASVQAQIGLGRLAEAERIFNEARDDPRIDSDPTCPSCSAPVYQSTRSPGRSSANDRVVLGGVEPGGRRAIRSWPSIWFGHTSTSDVDPVPIAGSRRSSRAGLADGARRRPDLAGKSQPGDSQPARTTRPRGGSTPACERRPEDPARSWRARLDWAVAANRVAEAREALRASARGSVDSGTDPQVDGLVRRPTR